MKFGAASLYYPIFVLLSPGHCSSDVCFHIYKFQEINACTVQSSTYSYTMCVLPAYIHSHSKNICLKRRYPKIQIQWVIIIFPIKKDDFWMNQIPDGHFPYFPFPGSRPQRRAKAEYSADPKWGIPPGSASKMLATWEKPQIFPIEMALN